ncbi:hypothetical protein EON80_03285 [bacterium]|nr:MAG: hypothetical protein EON80_03285 [bacterium]
MTCGPRMKSAFSRREVVALVALLIFALLIRLWNLGSFPDTLNPDEADTLQDSLRILYGAPPIRGFFGFDWKPQPAFSIYLLAGFLRVFGESIAVTRLPSALFSTIALVPFWWLVRRQVGGLAAWCATFLLSTSVWYLHFSRSGWENVHVALWMLMGMVCLVKLLDSHFKARWWLAGTIVFCTLGLYGYFGGRAIWLATLVYFFGLAIKSAFPRRQALSSAALVFVGALLLFTPQIISITQDFISFNERTSTVLIFNSPEWKSDPVGTASQQIVHNVTGFWRGSPNNRARYLPIGLPSLDRISGLFLAAGMLVSVLRHRYRSRFETGLWWTMLLVSWGLTQLLSTNTPDPARGVGWMPTLYFFVALGLDILIRRSRSKTHLACYIIPSLVVLIGLANVRLYVDWQSDSKVREARQPYIRPDEFEKWKSEVIVRSTNRMPTLNAGDWRRFHE